MPTKILYTLTLLGLLLPLNSLFAQSDLASSLTNECTSPKSGWIWCDDFESDRSADYFEGATDRQALKGVNGSTGAAFHYSAGVSDAGSIRVAFGKTPSAYLRPVDSGVTKYREVYWRIYLFVPSTWQGAGADKLSRAMVLSASDWSQAMIAHVWSGKDQTSEANLLVIDPASGTDTNGTLITSGYNDFQNLRWLGKLASSTPIFSSNNLGKWQCIEAHVKLNDAGTSNGIFQLTINGALEAEHTSLNWVGNYSDYGINAIFFENYWNNTSPVNQTRYFDNLVISTQPIGCGTSNIVRPLAPTNFSATVN